MSTSLLEKLMRHEDLTDGGGRRRHARGDGRPRVRRPRLAALLSALVMKGERPAEVVGFARTMRDHAVKLSAPAGDVFDTCGTGGDRSGTFNISSAAALVVAACGVKVAKHGNRSVSSRCGSADVFEAARRQRHGDRRPVVERSLHDANIAFFFAPTFHPSMKHAAQTRRELGIRTAFNLLGPLTNPAGARRQIVGVPTPELADLVARALLMLGSERAWVVHGVDGIDEISTTGLYEGAGVPRRQRSTRSTSIRRSSACRRRRRLICREAMRAQNASIVRDDPRREARPAPRRRAAERRGGAVRRGCGGERAGRASRERRRPSIEARRATTLETMVRSSQEEAVA